MSRDARRRRPKPKKRSAGGTIPDQGKGYVPALHYSLFTESIGFGAPKRPCEKSKENHWGAHVRFPQCLESQLFSVGDICTISEPDTFYRGLKCTLFEFLPFDQMWKVKLDMRTNIVKVSETYLTKVKSAHQQSPDHAKDRTISNEVVLNLKHDSVDPWGVAIDFDMWKITRVHCKKQWERVGAQVGYDVLTVNGVSVRSDPKTFKDMLMVGPDCTVVLGISDAGIGFRDSFLEQNMALAEVELMEKRPKPPKIECKRCGCTGHRTIDGYLFDQFLEKKCFCDSCFAHGCDIVKFTKRKRRV